MKKLYRSKKPDIPEAESFDLDLAPMLALMVTLIPIMLLSTVFVHVKVIETPLPQVVQKAIEKDQNKKDRSVTLYVDMSHNSGFSVRTIQNGKNRTLASIPKQSESWDFAKLHAELVKVKQQHPSVFQLNLMPQADVSYEDIVKVIDEARNSKSGEAKFMIKDQNTEKKETKLVETDVMFPNVIFANVVEG